MIKTRLTEQFTNAKLEGANILSPRNGYYFIKEVNYRDFQNKGKHPIAVVLWQPEPNQAFVTDVTFEIALSSLNLGGPFDYLNTVNKTIVISNVSLNTTGQETSKHITCNYEILSERPMFTTLQSLVLFALEGNIDTMFEHVDEFVFDPGADPDIIDFDPDSDIVYGDPTDEN